MTKKTLRGLTWVSEFVLAGRSADEPITRYNKKIIVVAFVGTGQPVDQFDVNVLSSEMAGSA
jgi:hypothetical protein